MPGTQSIIYVGWNAWPGEQTSIITLSWESLANCQILTPAWFKPKTSRLPDWRLRPLRLIATCFNVILILSGCIFLNLIIEAVYLWGARVVLYQKLFVFKVLYIYLSRKKLCYMLGSTDFWIMVFVVWY